MDNNTVDAAGNTAVAVAANVEYAMIEVEGEYLIFADARRQAVGPRDNTVIATITGKELVGVEYEPLFNPHEFVWIGSVLLRQ